MLARAWRFLTNPENRATLAWLGGGAVAAVTLGVTLFGGTAPKHSAPAPTVSAPGGVAVGTMSGGTVNVTPAPRP
jgi:hypothetical protein